MTVQESEIGLVSMAWVYPATGAVKVRHRPRQVSCPKAGDESQTIVYAVTMGQVGAVFRSLWFGVQRTGQNLFILHIRLEQYAPGDTQGRSPRSPDPRRHQATVVVFAVHLGRLIDLLQIGHTYGLVAVPADAAENGEQNGGYYDYQGNYHQQLNESKAAGGLPGYGSRHSTTIIRRGWVEHLVGGGSYKLVPTLIRSFRAYFWISAVVR